MNLIISTVGGNYGLLNNVTYEPNPDYYAAKLWKQNVGEVTLKLNISKTLVDNYVRIYSSCHPSMRGDVTLLVINLHNGTSLTNLPGR